MVWNSGVDVVVLGDCLYCEGGVLDFDCYFVDLGVDTLDFLSTTRT